MKRDMDLVRQILLKTEEIEPWSTKSTWRGVRAIIDDYRDEEGFLDIGRYLGIEDYRPEIISEHAGMMANEAGLIEVTTTQFHEHLREKMHTVYLPIRLTWQGHEFLGAVRDNDRWEKVKGKMTIAGGFVFEVAKALAISYLEDAVGLT